MDAIPTLGQINIYIGILNPEASHYTIIIHLYYLVQLIEHPILQIPNFNFPSLTLFLPGKKLTLTTRYGQNQPI